VGESKTISNTEFIEAVADTVNCLRSLADAYQVTRARSGHTPAADSRAMAEIASEQKERAWTWDDAATEAHRAAGFLVFAGLDHLAAYAHLFSSPPVPVYSHLAVARAAVEAFGWAYWLADPDRRIDPAARVKRGQVHALADGRERKRLPGADLKKIGIDIIDRVRAGAPAGWTVVCNDRQVRVGDVELPTSKKIIGAVLGPPDMAGSARDAAGLWSMLSATSHSTRYALHLRIGRPNEPLSSVEPIVVPLQTESESVHIYGAAIAQAAINATTGFLTLMGWETEEWRSAARRADAHLRAVMKAVKDKA
jgi:hypothetical protein